MLETNAKHFNKKNGSVATSLWLCNLLRWGEEGEKGTAQDNSASTSSRFLPVFRFQAFLNSGSI